MKSINYKNLYLELSALNSAITFLTIIKLPLKNFSPSASVKYFPVVGLFIGIILYTIGTMNHFLTPLLQLIFLIVITGALHLDGLADASDAIFSHRSLEEKLNIMKDSHIGTMGVIALIIVIISKFTALKQIDDKNILLIFIPAYARMAITLAIYFLPYIRQNSINKQFFEKKSFTLSLPILFIIIISFFADFRTFFIFVITLIITILLIYYFKRTFQGLTGDILGFICETTESLLLLSIVLF